MVAQSPVIALGGRVNLGDHMPFCFRYISSIGFLTLIHNLVLTALMYPSIILMNKQMVVFYLENQAG